MKPVPTIPVKDVLNAAQRAMANYSPYWQRLQSQRLWQFSEEISLIYKPNGTVIDLGGGDGIRAAICSELGMRAYNVDRYELDVAVNDHMPEGFLEEWHAAADVAKSIGVTFEKADVISWRTALSDIDVVMSFAALEHLHHSPRSLFKHLTERLRPGGQFFVGAPNAANLLKRLRVLAGKNVFSKMKDWYYTPHFVGHVREPIVADLHEIAKDLGLQGTVLGANWLGFDRLGHDSVVARLADMMLRPFPSLCSDIYLLAQKGA